MARTSLARRRAGWLNIRRREAIEGYLYLAPWAAGFLAFIGGPTIASLYLSFNRYDIVKPPVFVGIQNYVHAFAQDPQFWPSLVKTFYFAGVYVPLTMVASLLLALFLNRSFRGISFFRTIYFLPSLVPIVATTVIWVWILHPQVGLVNYLLSLVGIAGPGWLGTIEWAIPSLILLSLWRSAGGETMLIFLAGLQGVPRELYEAAGLDGAGGWQRFRHVTVPLISPTILFNLILGIIGGLKVFTTAFVATQGGPAYATWFYALNIYAQAFQFFQMGYASCLAWIFLIIVLVLTYLQFRSSSRWVYYEGETR
ncbi:MAG: carbohydrate ABC transporter permease [Chloroflexota bacterium]